MHPLSPSASLRRFLVGSDSSDSDDDKRVVRSAKDRRFEELNATCAELRVRSMLFAIGGPACFSKMHCRFNARGSGTQHHCSYFHSLVAVQQ